MRAGDDKKFALLQIRFQCEVKILSYKFLPTAFVQQGFDDADCLVAYPLYAGKQQITAVG